MQICLYGACIYRYFNQKIENTAFSRWENGVKRHVLLYRLFLIINVFPLFLEKNQVTSSLKSQIYFFSVEVSWQGIIYCCDVFSSFSFCSIIIAVLIRFFFFISYISCVNRMAPKFNIILAPQTITLLSDVFAQIPCILYWFFQLDEQ